MRFCTGMYKCFVEFYNARAHWSKAGGVWRTCDVIRQRLGLGPVMLRSDGCKGSNHQC